MCLCDPVKAGSWWTGICKRAACPCKTPWLCIGLRTHHRARHRQEGASCGGLERLERMLNSVPCNSQGHLACGWKCHAGSLLNTEHLQEQARFAIGWGGNRKVVPPAGGAAGGRHRRQGPPHTQLACCCSGDCAGSKACPLARPRLPVPSPAAAWRASSCLAIAELRERNAVAMACRRARPINRG